MKDRIVHRIEYPYPIQQVWQAISHQEAMSEWLMPCDIQPVLGHRFHFKTKAFPGFDGNIACEVLEVQAPELLSFSWSGGPLERTIVTFRLEAAGEHTILHFEHKGFDGLLNRLIVKRILSNGWKSKILPQLLLQYLEQHG